MLQLKLNLTVSDLSFQCKEQIRSDTAYRWYLLSLHDTLQ